MIFDDFVELMDTENFDDFGDFDKVTKKRSPYKDLHAFMLLAELMPGEWNIVGSAEHDKIYLSLNVVDLAPFLTPELVYELMHCGIMYDSDAEALAMYV